MYDSYEEVYYVLEKMRPRLEAGLEAKGFVVLNWADGGWVHFFAQKPVADARRPQGAQALQLGRRRHERGPLEVGGLQPRAPARPPRSPPRCRPGLVNALGCPPQVAVIAQYYNHAKNMTALPWQLLLGATVINKAVWETHPRRHPAGAAPGRARGGDAPAGGDPQDGRSGRGGHAQARPQRGGRGRARRASSGRRRRRASTRGSAGSVVPADAFDEALRYRDEYRKSKGAR